jgi:hypothetical protein
MSAFSDANEPVSFGRLHPDQIAAMVSILRQASIHRVDFVETVYVDRAKNFRETLRFLKAAGWITENFGNISLTGLPAHSDIPVWKIVEHISETITPYQAILADYLSQFRVHEGKAIHHPSAQRRAEQSGVRNFLMALGLITHNTEDDIYVLGEKFVHLFLWAKNVQGPTSKAELLRMQQARDQVGTLAEIEVLNYERRRVGPQLREHVQHISAKNPAACFDIQSVSLENREHVPRFIEVKAISVENCQFY